jgi:uncharacterized protein YabE (DUF348 family)
MTKLPPPSRNTLVHKPNNRASAIRPTYLIVGFGILLALILLVAFALFLYLFQLSQVNELTLIVGGDVRRITTRAETVEDLLTTLKIDIGASDNLSVPLDAALDEGMVVQVERAREVRVLVDGEARLLRTTRTNPADILQSANIAISADDRVLVDGTLADPTNLSAWPVPANQIVIHRAYTLVIQDQGATRRVRTAAETVGQALYDAGVTLYLADEVEPDLSASITQDMTVQIYRAFPARVIVDGQTIETRTRAETVMGLLADAGVLLFGLDYSIPDENVTVQPGMTVRVIRVTEAIIGETDVIPFDNITQADAALELDEIRLVQPGQDGLRQTDTRVRYENGVEISRTPLGTYTLREPESRVVAYGTGIVVRTIDTEQGAREYWRKIRMLATSYHPAALGGSNITATGRLLTKGVVGIDPTVIPYGTELYVPGYGVGIAADTGGPRSTRLWIDLGYDDDNWIPWSQYVDVYILTPVPNDIQYVLPD